MPTITLEEDNGFLTDGKPTLVVLVVADDQGKQVRIPYEATRTIQELYQDVAKIEFKAVVAPFVNQIDPPPLPKEAVKPYQDDLHKRLDHGQVLKNEIEREDIIKCIKQEKDLDGNVNEDIEVGKEYRVLDIYKNQGKVIYYDVLDDEKDSKIRIPILPCEVELVKKHTIHPKRKTVPDMIKSCEICGEQNAIQLNGDKYEGKCEKCGANITAERPTANV